MADNSDNVIKILLDAMSKSEIESDAKTEDYKTFRKKTTVEITERDKQYTELLEHFVSITKVRNILKEIFKWFFYLIIVLSMGILSYIVLVIFRRIINTTDINQIIDTLPLLITSIVGFVSTIISIPLVITKYLFSTKEDRCITQIILHTQDHDISSRDWVSNFKEMFSQNDKISKEESMVKE